MPTVTQSFQVEPNTLAAGKQLSQFITDLKGALKSGNGFAEAMAVAAVALKDLPPMLVTVPLIPGEAKDDLGAEVLTIAAVGVMIYKALVN
jgi:hypothetical protein